MFFLFRDGFLHVDKLGLWEGILDEQSFESIIDKAYQLDFFSWNQSINGSVSAEKTTVEVSWIDPNNKVNSTNSLKITQIGNSFQPMIDLENYIDSFQSKIIWTMDTEQGVR